MPLDVNQKIIFNALCKSICPNLKQQFVAEKRIKRELNFFMDMYAKAVLEITPNEELLKSLEKIMMDKIGVCGESKMCEAQYRIKMRAELDANPETFGQPIGPCSIFFHIFDIEREEGKHEWKEFDDHKQSSWVRMKFSWEKTSSEFLKEVKENIMKTRDEKKMRVYIKTDKKTSYTTSELFQLGYTNTQICDYEWEKVSAMVNMEEYIIEGIVLFF
jgi:hypothetical protein